MGQTHHPVGQTRRGGDGGKREKEKEKEKKPHTRRAVRGLRDESAVRQVAFIYEVACYYNTLPLGTTGLVV